MFFLDNQSGDPLYLQIYKQIKKKIISGQIIETTKLPSTRTLSKTLNVSRNTVEYAYLQLCSEGYITSKACSGFIVEKLDNVLSSEKQIPITNKKRKHLQTSPNVNLKNTCKYNFQYGKLNANSFPLRLWRKISNQCLSSLNVDSMMSYNEPQGELSLRIEIMKYLNVSRGVSCQPEQIIIGSGTQSCLTLLCQLFRSHSINVAIEDPGYDGARDVFVNNGYNVIPISLRNGSIDIGELENSLAKIIYITPSHQFPTGAVMPIHERLKLLNWAIKNKVIIIEDDYDSELRYNTKPIPSIHCIESQENVLYLGTFSKSLAPALRLNYMVLPQSWLEKYRILFAKYNSTVSLHQQKILQQFMHLGYWDRHLKKSCLSYKKKHDTLVRTITQVMGDNVTIHGKNAGLHIVLEFNNGLSEKELIEKANHHGVLVYPVSRYWMRLERYSNNMILLGFSELDENEIVEGINILNHAWFGN